MFSRAAFVVLIVTPLACAAEPTPVKFGKLTAAAPAEWKSEKPANRLRSHQFKLASGTEGVSDAEVIVSPEASANVEKEFPRWKAAMLPPDDKTIDDVAKTGKFEVGGATVHLLDVRGTWKYRAAPNDPKSKEERKPEYRVVWGIVVAGEDATHVRLSGPEAVVAKQYAGFETWLKSLK